MACGSPYHDSILHKIGTKNETTPSSIQRKKIYDFQYTDNNNKRQQKKNRQKTPAKEKKKEVTNKKLAWETHTANVSFLVKCQKFDYKTIFFRTFSFVGFVFFIHLFILRCHFLVSVFSVSYNNMYFDLYICFLLYLYFINPCRRVVKIFVGAAL